MPPAISFSAQARRTADQPISHYMKLAIENPELISLAAGLVDQESLPVADAGAVLADIFADSDAARSALQYGTTHGLASLRERLWHHVAHLDGVPPDTYGLTAEQVLITTGSQQSLYLLSEALFDEGDYIITEEPSYFVHHGVLTGHGVRVLTVPMDDGGMDTAALETLLEQMARDGRLNRLKMIYTCDYFQNPSGRTLALERRPHLAALARRFSTKHRLLVLEDAAYRELGFAPASLPSVKSFERDNQNVIYAGTFSKPCAPGLKTGYALLPADLIPILLRLKGIHDFGSANLNQHILDRLMASGAYARHVIELKQVYQEKCRTFLAALDESFGDWPAVRWTRPTGGMFVWLSMPEGFDTGPDGKLLHAALEEGMLYVPGEFCHVPDAHGRLRRNEMRLCYGVETPDRLREATRRLRRAANRVRG